MPKPTNEKELRALAQRVRRMTDTAHLGKLRTATRNEIASHRENCSACATGPTCDASWRLWRVHIIYGRRLRNLRQLSKQAKVRYLAETSLQPEKSSLL
jgi:hypothetical protein